MRSSLPLGGCGHRRPHPRLPRLPFAAASGNSSEPIVNFSTPPTWLYDPSNFAYPDDPTVRFIFRLLRTLLFPRGCRRPFLCLQVSWYGYEQGTAPAANLTALGDYYGRLLSWYTLGGFTDEYGAYHASGHFLDIQNYEVFNGACASTACFTVMGEPCFA